MPETLRALPSLLLILAICYGVAFFAAQFQPDTWYTALEKPAWTPPEWVFAPVWSLLYGMMAVAAWLVWQRRDSDGVAAALAAFAFQLVLNGAWSWLFFGLNLVTVALAEILLLWLAVALTTVLFFRQRALAGWLLVPYLIWLSYAVSLNAGIAALN